MGTAYTPGLTISRNVRIRKTRRLPLKGETLVAVGDIVTPETVVARAELPGPMQTVRVAETLGLEPSEVLAILRVKVGDRIERGQVLAESRSLFGLIHTECRAPISGTVELISERSGHVGIRQFPTPVEVTAYISGVVAEVIPSEGVIVETNGAFIQGIFGVGGERTGEILIAESDPEKPLIVSEIQADLSGKILVGGSSVDAENLARAAEGGAVGVVVGGIIDTELIEFVGHDIGVAITGQEDIPLTLILTEGFGQIMMARRTYGLLTELAGKKASINGATQIRAGVIRPEVVVPLESQIMANGKTAGQTLEIGSQIRIIREPYFGALGKVVALPTNPTTISSGSVTRVLETELEDGRRVSVPRANVEIIQD